MPVVAPVPATTRSPGRPSGPKQTCAAGSGGAASDEQAEGIGAAAASDRSVRRPKRRLRRNSAPDAGADTDAAAGGVAASSAWALGSSSPPTAPKHPPGARTLARLASAASGRGVTGSCLEQRRSGAGLDPADFAPALRIAARARLRLVRMAATPSARPLSCPRRRPENADRVGHGISAADDPGSCCAELLRLASRSVSARRRTWRSAWWRHAARCSAAPAAGGGRQGRAQRRHRDLLCCSARWCLSSRILEPARQDHGPTEPETADLAGMSRRSAPSAPADVRSELSAGISDSARGTSD